MSQTETILYRRQQFATRFPPDHIYTRSHFWLAADGPDRWRVGLTAFATRMLGEIVELSFEISPGRPVRVADTIGWIEGFKAVSDLYCVAEGWFLGQNPMSLEDVSLICAHPHTGGWLYAVEGTPDPDALDVRGYMAYLDQTIDRMAQRPWEAPEGSPP